MNPSIVSMRTASANLPFQYSMLGRAVQLTDEDLELLGLEEPLYGRPDSWLEILHPITAQVYGYLFASDSEMNEIQLLNAYNKARRLDDFIDEGNSNIVAGLILDKIVPFEGEESLQTLDGTIIFGSKDYEGNGSAILWFWRR